MEEEHLIIRCLCCGTKNRIPSARLHDRPTCGQCHACLDDIIISCLYCGAKNRMPEHRLHEKPICGICGRAIVSGETSKILEVDDASFPREVLHYTGAVVVICRSDLDNTEYSLSIDPLFERLIDQYAYGVKAARLEISKNHLMAAQYNIRSAPTILFFKGGQLLHALAENLSREEIERHLSAIAEID